MRRIIAIISVLCMMALLPACGAQGNAPGAAQQSPSSTPASSADFSDTDFSGHWAVTQVFDSEGEEASAAKLAELEGFVLELLPDGTYFVYNAEGKVLGQGSYKVEKDIMILQAGGVQTVYTATDANTLRGATADGCVTILTRQPEPTPTPDEQEPGDAEGEDAEGEPEAAEGEAAEGEAAEAEPSEGA